MNDNKRKSIKNAKLITEICISAAIIAGAGYYVHTITSRTQTVISSPFIDSSSDTDSNIESITGADGKKTIYQSVEVATKKKYKGDLILVNNDQQYYTGEEDLITINDEITSKGWTGFTANDESLQLCTTPCDCLGKLLQDFSTATGITDVVVLDAYRTQQQQKTLYDDDLASTGLDHSERVAMPGYSEHQTGFAIDLTTSENWDYDGTGSYAWINDNCWKYGYILRYPENKTDKTKFKYEPWHYRYVGVPHAYYIHKNNLCLEEYISQLKSYTYDGQHLCFTDDNGVAYEVYYVPSDDANDTTYVSVPVDLKYDISGNNSDGFIVTVYKDSDTDTTQAATSADASAATDTTTADQNSTTVSATETSPTEQ
ncbi:MAG: M15 family metallopeptidase [Ruminococcus sp.]|nr:M15 family metallopeptidase [Ruminococcus sp.]